MVLLQFEHYVTIQKHKIVQAYSRALSRPEETFLHIRVLDFKKKIILFKKIYIYTLLYFIDTIRLLTNL